MASNLPIAGLGRSTTVGGYGGSGLVTGSAALVQNPSYETPGTNIGEAVNWSITVVSTLSEYALFDHPGSSIITDQIPAEQPTLGYTIVHQLDGTLIISQATDADSAQEDFEQGWLGNENFDLIFYDPANDPANFHGQSFDNFENGWGNDSGLLDNIDAISNVAAVFNAVPVEHFAAGWPTSFTGVLIDNIPNVSFGSWDDNAGVYTRGDEVIAAGQYVDVLTLRVTSPLADPTVFVINTLNQHDLLVSLPVSITSQLKFGDIVTANFLVPFGIGVRNIDSITIGPGSNGTYAIEGDPGFKRDEHGIIIARWERAMFG